MKYHSIISSTIGATPLVRLNRINEDVDAEIFAKLEFFNPLGSVKDRIAASMIEAGELDGSSSRPAETRAFRWPLSVPLKIIASA